MKKHGVLFQLFFFCVGLFFTFIGCFAPIMDGGATVFFYLVYVGGLLLLCNKSFYFGNVVALAYLFFGVIYAIFGFLCILVSEYQEKTKGINVTDNNNSYVAITFILAGIIMLIRAILHETWGLCDKGTVIAANRHKHQKENTYNTKKIESNEIIINNHSRAEQFSGGQIKIKELREFSMDDINSISSISGKKLKGDLFELYCARLLELNLFSNIKIVGGSGDKGVDIIAWKGRKKVAIQCKCYANTVPYHALEQIVTARKNIMASEGILITNSYFSEQTKEVAPELQIYLWDRNKLQQLIDIANEVGAENKLKVVEESEIS